MLDPLRTGDFGLEALASLGARFATKMGIDPVHPFTFGSRCNKRSRNLALALRLSREPKEQIVATLFLIINLVRLDKPLPDVRLDLGYTLKSLSWVKWLNMISIVMIKHDNIFASSCLVNMP